MKCVAKCQNPETAYQLSYHGNLLIDEISWKCKGYNQMRLNAPLYRGFQNWSCFLCDWLPAPWPRLRMWLVTQLWITTITAATERPGLGSQPRVSTPQSSPFHFPTPAIRPAPAHLLPVWSLYWNTSLPVSCRNLIAYLRSKLIPRSAITCYVSAFKRP